MRGRRDLREVFQTAQRNMVIVCNSIPFSNLQCHHFRHTILPWCLHTQCRVKPCHVCRMSAVFSCEDVRKPVHNEDSERDCFGSLSTLPCRKECVFRLDLVLSLPKVHRSRRIVNCLEVSGLRATSTSRAVTSSCTVQVLPHFPLVLHRTQLHPTPATNPKQFPQA